MKLNTENAKVFNSSLKEAIRKLTNQKVKVRIINSYKFPNCYVEVVAETEFSNDFKLNVFDAFGNKRDGLLNVENVSYGNIQSKYITGKVFQWENLFNEINLKEFEKGGKMKEPTIVRGFSDDEPYEYADGGMMAKGGDVKDNFDWSKMSFNERLILARESGLEKPSKIAITEIGLLKPNEISALKNSIRLRNEVYGDNTMMADGGMMAKGGLLGGFNYSIGGL